MSSVAHIALVPKGQRVDMSEVASVAAAISIQIVRDFAPIWGISATVSAFTKPNDVPVGYWPIYVEESSQMPSGVRGLHLDNRKQPYAVVEFGDHWSLSASHECLEMLVDPSGNRLQASPLLEAAVQQGLALHQVQYVVGICDPVEDAQYGYQINGHLMSDFFTPHFYGPATCNGLRYDYVGALSGPLEVLENGSISWLDPVTGDVLQLQNFMGPDRRLHPQVLNLSHSDAFHTILAREAYRPAIDRVTGMPDLFMNLSLEQQMSMETRQRAVRHAAQIRARRMNEELFAAYEATQANVSEPEYDLAQD